MSRPVGITPYGWKTLNSGNVYEIASVAGSIVAGNAAGTELYPRSCSDNATEGWGPPFFADPGFHMQSMAVSKSVLFGTINAYTLAWRAADLSGDAWKPIQNLGIDDRSLAADDNYLYATHVNNRVYRRVANTSPNGWEDIGDAPLYMSGLAVWQNWLLGVTVDRLGSSPGEVVPGNLMYREKDGTGKPWQTIEGVGNAASLCVCGNMMFYIAWMWG